MVSGWVEADTQLRRWGEEEGCVGDEQARRWRCSKGFPPMLECNVVFEKAGWLVSVAAWDARNSRSLSAFPFPLSSPSFSPSPSLYP